MKKSCYFVAILLIISLFTGQVSSAELSFKGYMFGEYYFVLSHNSGTIEDGGIEGRNGFWMRRIYFTTDAKLTDNIKARLRLEMGSPGGFPFDSSGKLTPAVKDAYISYQYSGQDIMKHQRRKNK